MIRGGQFDRKDGSDTGQIFEDACKQLLSSENNMRATADDKVFVPVDSTVQANFGKTSRKIASVDSELAVAHAATLNFDAEMRDGYELAGRAVAVKEFGSALAAAVRITAYQ